MVKLVSSKTFVVDPADAWGNEHVIGLAENAVRTHAPPKTYDRRGDIIYWNEFESGTTKYTPTIDGAGGSINRSIDYANRGDFSLKCVTGAVGADSVSVGYKFTDFHPSGKVGIETMFTSADNNYGIYLDLDYDDGTTMVVSSLRWWQFTNKLEYVNSDGVYTTISTDVKRTIENPNWSSIKLVIDLSTAKYVRALMFGQEFDLSAHDIRVGITTSIPHIQATFKMMAGENAAKTGYLDNVIFTENEPA